ncbi:hypothetical protein [Corallococcus sp. RDP092CA]|uniref:hypothetical protein n=1 Tax=Corallococcus sp. RDP092CA TaxID=3109369 RepID=UPI0035B44731
MARSGWGWRGSTACCSASSSSSRAGPLNFRRALLITPSPAHLARLPGGRIPDRSDFTEMQADDRIRAWQQVLTEGDRMADELRELLASGRIAEHVQPLG